MELRKRLWVVGLSAVGLSLSAGCSRAVTVRVRHARPAEVEIPARARRLRVAAFAATPEDRCWAELASRKLSAALARYGRVSERFKLLDAKAAGGPTNADAVIKGTVNTSARSESGTQGGAAGKACPAAYTRRVLAVTVRLTVTEVATGNTLAAITIARTDESGPVGGRLPAAEKVLATLVHECVEGFVAKIRPRVVAAAVTLWRSDSRKVEEGSELAAAGQYEAALRRYLDAIGEAGDDAAAVFNAGVMYETANRLSEARRYYAWACELRPSPACREGLARLTELSGP